MFREAGGNLKKKIQVYQQLWQEPLVTRASHIEKMLPTRWLDIFINEPLQDISNNFWNNSNNAWPEEFLDFYTWCQHPLASCPENYDAGSRLNISGISQKKNHELQALHILTNQLNLGKRGLDIAGGAGHLANLLARKKYRITSLDYNQKLQEKGRRLYRDANIDFQKKNICLDDLRGCFQKCDFVIGLHTCGSLADRQIDEAIKANTKTIINIGCCYDKIHAAEAKEKSQIFSASAMMLASRYHPAPTKTPMASAYRFGLELLLNHSDIAPIKKLGRPKKNWLRSDFASYVSHTMQSLNKKNPWKDTELNNFFYQKKNQIMLKRLVTANYIRILVGRPIEAYIVVCRAQRLTAAGFQVQIKEIFSPHISPRNYVILASKNKLL